MFRKNSRALRAIFHNRVGNTPESRDVPKLIIIDGVEKLIRLNALMAFVYLHSLSVSILFDVSIS